MLLYGISSVLVVPSVWGLNSPSQGNGVFCANFSVFRTAQEAQLSKLFHPWRTANVVPKELWGREPGGGGGASFEMMIPE